MTKPEAQELAELKKQLAEANEALKKAQEKSEEHLDGWKRAKADYLNLKKESEKAQTEIAGYATGMVIFELLPIVDNFERAIDHLTEDQKNEEWIKGMLGIHQQLQQLLKDMGIEHISTDVPFNPEIHEAIGKEFHEHAAEGSIVKVVAPGYRMNGKLIRPAQVVVAAAQEAHPNEASKEEKQ